MCCGMRSDHHEADRLPEYFARLLPRMVGSAAKPVSSYGVVLSRYMAAVPAFCLRAQASPDRRLIATRSGCRGGAGVLAVPLGATSALDRNPKLPPVRAARVLFGCSPEGAHG